MRAVPVGFMLHPDLAFHRLAVPLVRRHVDYVGIAPETTWRQDGSGALVDNDYSRLFAEVAAAFELPVVAHGVGLSPASEADDGRLDAWADRLAADPFDYGWWTDHHGLAMAGEWLALPMPPLPTARAVTRTADRLRRVAQGVRPVGLETTAFYAHWGDPMADATLQTDIAHEADSHVLLDLHNVWTMARNGGFDAAEWLAHLDLSRVIEIHIAGGSPVDPAWGGQLRPMWLDGHDGAVPEPVWSLLEAVLPYCPNLRGVLLERMEGTVDDTSVNAVEAELVRLRGLCAAVPTHTAPKPKRATLLPELSAHQAHAWQKALGPALRSANPVAAVHSASALLPEVHADAVRTADRDGLLLSAMLIAKLRYERVLHGVPGAMNASDADPEGFTQRFFAYHRTTPARAQFPWQEAASFGEL